MENEKDNTCIQRSQSLESLHIHTATEPEFLSSTKQPIEYMRKFKTNNRRLSILPTPNQPKRNQINLNTLESVNPIQEEGIDEMEKIMRDLTIHDHTPTKKEEDKDHSSGNEFDSFILRNFLSFSGKENVIQWLDETETKFNQFHMGRNLRFEAISLLVEGVAKRKYLQVRKTIRSFDDFYDFLLSTFDTSSTNIHQSSSHQDVENSTKTVTESYQQKTILINDRSSPDQNDSKTKSLVDSSTTYSSGVHKFGLASNSGQIPVNKSSIFSETQSSSIHEETLSDLRKAIVENLIKTPKTFKGGKDDVQKWVEEIEHLFDIAHIPEPTRLDLVSYSLRNEALEWFKDNRTLFTSWSVFVTEIKKAFTSLFREEIAFQKLEEYSHAENQSIRSFFTETLKLCKEADPAMTESTKLKYLLNKAKPSVQYEVRKKKPTTTAEFLQFAKEAEELMQLSHVINDNTNTKSSPNPQTTSRQQPLSSPSYASSANNTVNTYASNPPRSYNRNYQYPPNSDSYSYNHYSQYQPTGYSQSKPYSNNNYSQPNRQSYSNNSYNRSYQNVPSNNTGNRSPQPRTVNIIDVSCTRPNSNPAKESPSPSTCSRCGQLGHESSTCPSF